MEATPGVGERRAAHRPSRRDDIRRAGVRLFARAGYLDTTVADVAREAGMSERAFYYHFATKESLLLDAVRPVADAILEIIARAMAAYHPRQWREAMARILEGIFSWADAHPDEANLYYVWSRLGLPAVAAIRDDLLAACLELSNPRPARPLARTPAGQVAQELAAVVAIDTADDVMSALFAGDGFVAGVDRAEVARVLADNNGALIAERRADAAVRAVDAARTPAHRSVAARPGTETDGGRAAGATTARGAHRPSRRVHLLRAATAEFAERGVAAATLTDITDRAGMAPNALYYHYDSKQELVLDVLERVSAQVADHVVPTTDGPDKATELLAAWSRFARWAEAHPHEARVHLTASAAISLETEQVRRSAQQAVVQRLAAWMRHGTRRSSPLDAEVGAIALSDLFRRATAKVLEPPGRTEVLDVAVVDVGLRILAGARCED